MLKQRVAQELRYGVVIVVPVVYITLYVQIYFNEFYPICRIYVENTESKMYVCP
jgi:hypothetical protein